MATSTIRYIGDNDPILLSASDDITGIRTDLSTVHSISILAIKVTDPTDTFSGPGVVINPIIDGEFNHKYLIVTGDTAAAGTFNVYSTVTEADSVTITTYGPITLIIKAKV